MDNNNLNNLVFFNLFNNFRNTGSKLFDTIMSTIIYSLITYIITLFRMSYLIKFKKIFDFIFKDNINSSIVFNEPAKEPTHLFKAVLFYINSKSNLKINKLKYYSFWNYNERSKKDHVYTINENEEIEIEEDVYILFTNYIETKQDLFGKSGETEFFIIKLYSKKKDIEFLKKLILSIEKKYDDYLVSKALKFQYFIDVKYQKEENKLIYEESAFNTYRTFDNMFFKDKELVLKKLDFFINNINWYKERGNPYTIGFLLHGDPGCGKTSFIKSILNKTKYHAININLSNNFNLNLLKKLMNDDKVGNLIIPKNKRIYIFEDIDAMDNIVKDREKFKNNISFEDLKSLVDKDSLNEENNNNNLSILLNILDGTIENPGRICIMTTNYKNHLDKALLRPGRIDYQINFTKCDYDMLYNIINNIFKNNFDKKLLNDYINHTISPSEINNICIDCFEDFDKAIKIIIDLSLSIKNHTHQHNH